MQGPAWSRLAEIDIRTVDKEDLIDISGIELDNETPKEQRGKYLLDRIKNPYCFKVGEIAVKVEFTPNAPPLQTCLTDFLSRKKSGL